MKYSITNTIVPKDRRKEINNKCLYAIENNISTLTPQMIFSTYSGEGGLHGLEFKEFDNYYSFSQAKRDLEHGEFFTPALISKFMVDCIKPNDHDLISDMTCGTGSFFNYLPVEHNIYGNEISISNYKVCKYLYPNANLQNEDIRNYNPDVKMDIVFGNPPFGLNFKVGKDEYLSQLYFCLKASEILKVAGFMILIVPCSFLSDSFSDSGMIKTINKHFNFICQFDLPTNAFRSAGVENFSTKIMFFQRQSEHLSVMPYTTNKIPNISITDAFADHIHSQYLLPYITKKESVKGKLFFENVHNSDSKESADFEYKVKKLLFDIKQHPKINSYYGKCLSYIDKFNTQKMPEGMKYEEWSKVKITEKKVLSYLKKTLAKQSKNERDEVRLVKTSYGIKLKPYSQKNKIFLSKYTGVKEMSFNDMVINGEYPFEDKSYYDLFIQKTKKYSKQNKSFNEMSENESIQNFLNTTSLHDYTNDEIIYLNDKQKIDINLSLQKNSSYLAWETGAGKSLSSIIYGLYRLQHNHVKNVFVVAPAIAIKNTFEPMLTNFKIPFVVVKNIEDIAKIQDGQFILITFNMLAKNLIKNEKGAKNKENIRFSKFVKKFITKNGYDKFCLILDEADQISNINSIRSKSVLNTFRKLKYKLLASGTNIRNNLTEFKTSLDLMYNNSINMLSTTEYIYNTDAKTGEIKQEDNPYYNKPIPAYHKGFKLYTSMFNPHKTTVLGISQYNQDIYNKDELKKMIDKTLLIRTLKDITGKQLYNINQIPCTFNNEEKVLYDKILEEFNTMMEYHIKTGNHRKDAMFRILAQLNTLLKCCSIPQTFKEYTGGTPSKFKSAFRLLEKFKDERVAIGCTRIKTVKLYAQQIRMRYPDRPLFVVTGAETTFKQRRNIVEQLKLHDNAILLSTQQALSCSVSIGFIDKVLIVENLWNDSSCQQYRARFTRYNSDNPTEIYNLFYDKSIEVNLMKLILAKEKLCLIMKNEDMENEELFEKYGIDSYIFNCLMEKQVDEDGRVQIGWGEQKIN
jgi:trans-aconitate methyltransferase